MMQMPIVNNANVHGVTKLDITEQLNNNNSRFEEIRIMFIFYGDIAKDTLLVKFLNRKQAVQRYRYYAIFLCNQCHFLYIIYMI